MARPPAAPVSQKIKSHASGLPPFSRGNKSTLIAYKWDIMHNIASYSDSQALTDIVTDWECELTESRSCLDQLATKVALMREISAST